MASGYAGFRESKLLRVSGFRAIAVPGLRVSFWFGCKVYDFVWERFGRMFNISLVGSVRLCYGCWMHPKPKALNCFHVGFGISV